MKPQLTIYKASAGSGKTFRLAVEYIKLVVSNPTKYRHILAVTFTNKATEEMKLRILSQLYGIWKDLPDSKNYLNAVCEGTGMPKQQVSKNAGIALQLLIHNYSYFRVETIDSFFQSVLRNLARELDLTANLRIGLNDAQVEEQAVDQMIDQLNHSSRILQWIISYIEQNIREDKSWNVIGQVKSFGKTIFRDFYKRQSEELNKHLDEKDFFKNYVSELENIREKAQKKMRDYADLFFNTLNDNGIDVDMLANKGRGIASYFRKLTTDDFSDKNCINATLTKHLESADNWVSKSSKDRQWIIPVVIDRLMGILKQTEQDRHPQWCLYTSAELTLRHLNQVRLLSHIEQKVQELNQEANRFLLSSTQQVLHSLIKDSDSPFIFEKIGTSLDHIMIDEFQDTSTVQWQNFLVLLKETMSHRDSSNLIVGDVKQSIYRWRSGDWRLLNNIEDQFGRSELLEVKSLKVNFRSCKNIVDFNNAFFTKAAQEEQLNENAINDNTSEQLSHAYADVEQQTPEGKKNDGLVRITLLPKEDYDQQMLSLVLEQVRDLVEEGIKQNEIAILVRANRYIPVIADYFAQQDSRFNIVSDEAFQLDASIAVCTIVMSLHLLTHPDEQLTKANLEKTLAHIHQESEEASFMSVNEFIKKKDVLRKMPLTDLVETIYQQFGLQSLENQGAYICKFLDELNTFITEFGSDIDVFVQEWNDIIHKKTIQSSSVLGIRIISIHKSKGLEFDNVIIPYCDWKLEMGGTLWCQPKLTPFNKLPLVPIDYSSKMNDSIYRDDYLEEHLQNNVDNLNMLYVAFTRAGKNLFVFGQRDTTGTRSTLLQNVLGSIELENATLQEDAENGRFVFEYGLLCNPNRLETEDKEAQTKNVFTQPVTPIPVTVNTFSQQVSFKQSNKSREFVQSDEDSEEKQQNDYIRIGNVMHYVFSQIHTERDINRVIRELEFEGVLFDDTITPEKIQKMLAKRLETPQVKDWFSDKWTLFNECSIISMNDDGSMEDKRPDRVMTDGSHTIVVDFKFGKHHDEYNQQVKRYMELLNKMGYPDVKGYLWYVYNNQIEEVKA